MRDDVAKHVDVLGSYCADALTMTAAPVVEDLAGVANLPTLATALAICCFASSQARSAQS